MKPAPLGLSLAANAVLLAGVAYLALAKSPPLPTERPKAEAQADLPKPAAPGQNVTPMATVVPPAAPPPASWQSPSDINAWLASTNAPLKVRYQVVEAILARKYGAQIEAFRFPPTMKKWQRSTASPTPEQREQQAALWQQQGEELKQLFGADYTKARYDEAAASRVGLSLEKFAALERIEQDYAQIRVKQLLDGTRAPGSQQLVDREMTTDLASILTPEELERHQAYESKEAQALQQWMAGLDVDDETYLRAYRAAAEARAGNSQSNILDRRAAEIQAIEKAVGPAIAHQVALNQDGNFREFDTIYLKANLTPAARYEKYQAWNDFQRTLDRLQGAATPGKLDAAQQAKVRTAYDRLTAGLSPAARAEFDRTGTGAFVTRLLAQPAP